MTDTVVSVIIPYSEEVTPKKYLKQSINSAKKQSINTKIIVVDDDSDNNNGKNGPAWARNKGFKKANTRFVAFLDADDIWNENKLKRQLDRMEKTDSGICVQGKQMSDKEFIKKVIDGSIYGITSSIVVDTEQLDTRFEEEIDRFEDHLFMIEATASAGICFCEDLFTLRKHEQGLSAQTTAMMICESRLKMVDIIENRIPEAEPYLSGLDMYRYYYGMGRQLQIRQEYRKSISYLLKSIYSKPTVKSFIVLSISVINIIIPVQRNE